MWGTLVQSLGWENTLEEGMATHSSILAWKIPMDRGAWWATVHGVAKSQDTIERLSHTHTYIHMCMHGKSLQSCLTLYDPMDYSFSVHEIFQVRILEWAAISFSRVSSPSTDRAYVS